MEPTVVGIVHPDEGARRALGERLEGEQGIVLAAVAGRLAELQLPDAGHRALVVGGAALDDPDLGRAGIPVVVAASGRLSEARAALAIGASDLIGWPREAAELASAVRRAAAERAAVGAAAPGRILAVIGARGGLGTTTIAAWLAQLLSAHALVELDPAGSLATYGDGGEPLLASLLAGTGAEHARGLLRDVGFGVPVCFGEPTMREPEAPALRALLASLRGLGGWSVLDLGRADGARLRVARAVDARVIVCSDEVAAVRAVDARRLAGTPWIRRRIGRRARIADRDLAEALGSAPLATVEDDARVAARADLGALAAAPPTLAPVLAHLDPSRPLASSEPVRGAAAVLGRVRTAFGALR